MYKVRIYDGANNFVREIKRDRVIFDSVQEGMNGETSASFSVRTLTVSPNGQHDINEDLQYLVAYNKVSIHYIGDGKDTIFYEGFISSITKGFDVFSCDCVGIHDYCLKKVLTSDLNITQNASEIASTRWEEIMGFFDSGVKMSCSVTDAIEFNLKAGSKFAQLLDAITSEGNEVFYSNNNILIDSEIGSVIENPIKFNFSSLNQNTCRAPEQIIEDGSQAADAVFARNENSNFFLNPGASNDLIMETVDFQSGDLATLAASFIEEYSKGYSEYEVTLDPDNWKPGDLRPGDSVYVDINLGIETMNIKGQTRVQSVSIDGSGTGYQIRVQLSNEPKNDISIKDITRRLKTVEDLLT